MARVFPARPRLKSAKHSGYGQTCSSLFQKYKETLLTGASPPSLHRSLEDLGDQSASSMLKASRARKKFDSTKHAVKDGPACRIYGTMNVKRVTGNLHVVGCTAVSHTTSTARS